MYCSWLFVGLCPFGNKFLIIQKKKEIVPVHNNEEIYILIIYIREKIFDRNTILIDDDFFPQVVMDIISNDEDQEPQNMNEFRHQNDWLKWKEAIQM